MGETDNARREIEASRERMSRIADELARRTSSGHVREVAKVKAKDAGRSPMAMSLVGAAAGAAIGGLVARQARQRAHERSRFYEPGGGFRTEGGAYVSRDYVGPPSYRGAGPDYSASPEVAGWTESYRSPEAEHEWAGGREGEGEGLKEKASHVTSGLKEKAQARQGELKERTSHLKESLSSRSSELRHRAQERASHVRERMPSGEELKSRAQEQPLAMILGGMVLGALAAALLPETRRERQTLRPAKERAARAAHERFDEAKQEMQSRFEGAKQAVMGKGAEEGDGRTTGEGFEEASAGAPQPGAESGWLPPEAPTEEDLRQQREVKSRAESEEGETVH